MIRKIFWGVICCLFCCCSEEDDITVDPVDPADKGTLDVLYMERAETTFDKLFELYWYDDMKIMYDKYPNLMATNKNTGNYPYDLGYAYAWGYGAVLSAYNAILQRTESYVNFQQRYEKKIRDGLEVYYTEGQHPPGYASFANSWDDRFYDDNVWFGIDLIELYDKTKDNRYLDKAQIVWRFILSGRDKVLGDGVYWKEREKNSKNTCSNAPVVVFGVKLYQSTADEDCLTAAKELYKWTKDNLQDPSDCLYWDNIKTSGTKEKPKFSYNSGQMIQAAALLYNATKEEHYLTEARQIAESAHNYFFESYTPETGETIRILKQGSLWFHAILLRGFGELYQIDKDKKYIKSFKQSLDHAWTYARDKQSGLFNADLSGRTTDAEKDLLTNGGIIEMYARMATLQ
ncbi:MAG: glycoside hydrolase family 76 protein [Dysgonamonadaceae bacterium]|nr:glycoside hydrolase family 76 protein [Dysgonamonadaceae bacterium]